MTTTTKTTKTIRNPQKWIGKYVRHMSNWYDLQCEGKYVVCQYTGKLMLANQDANPLDWFESLEDAEKAGYSEVAYYSEEALKIMASKA